MNIPQINLKAQYTHLKNDILPLLRTLLSEQKLILGEYGNSLEQMIAGYVDVPHAIACANGTDALILSLMALGIRHGDEVITTPYTFFSTASSIALVGAKPVFVDIEQEFMNINPHLIEAAITPRTKAIIVVHLFGKTCEIEEICDIGQRYGIPIVEDMAQSLGAQKTGGMCGSFGDIAALSFYPTKNLGGIGDGGMVLTRRNDLGEKVRKLRVHGMGAKQYHHDMIGINSRLDEINACVLTVKFKHLESWNVKRKENAQYYNERLERLPINLPKIVDNNSHIFHQYVIRVQERDKLQSFLKGKGIGTGIYYPVPLHLQECFAHLGYKQGDFPESESAALTSLALPVFPELKKKEKDYIILSIREFFGAP